MVKDRSNFEKSKKISDQIELILLEQKIQKQIDQIVFNLPNIAHQDVPLEKMKSQIR